MSTDLAPPATAPLAPLVDYLDAQPEYSANLASLHAGHSLTLGGVWGSSCALVVANLLRHTTGPLLVVLPNISDVESLAADLALFTTVSPAILPAWESASEDLTLADEIHGERLRLLKQLQQASPPRLLLTGIQALLQPLPSPAQLAQSTNTLNVGDQVDLPELTRWLVENGFESTTAVQLPGEFALRGGILDLFAADWEYPLRIEFFDDQVESIRAFEISTQRSQGALSRCDLTLIHPARSDRAQLTDYLPPGTWVLVVEPPELQEEARYFLQRVEKPQDYHELDDVTRALFQFPSITAAAIAGSSLEAHCDLRFESVERFSGDFEKVRSELDAAGQGQTVYLICPTPAEVERYQELFGQTALALAGTLHFIVGHLRSGFRLVSERIALVSANELFQRADVSSAGRKRLSRVIDSFLDLREGDYVVHLGHGIGKYRGLKLLEKGNQTEEHLEVEFRGGTKVFVPATNIELVQKYVGGTKSRPTLATIGGKTWLKQKAAAERAVQDLALDMLRLQATRASRPGISFPANSPWQAEFDAAFPFSETPDQLSAIAAIKKDMARPQPMDRLLCGDVGFGKTEVAMRGAFQAVEAGYQVAVLVPTTILAEQHGRSFKARLAGFPFHISTLSRFCTQKEQERILRAAAAGGVDIVIGTHRLAQHDVKFANLGLLIIDEEQRFGVDIKERLKALRATVDVLTMTATPIPRTLHMSLLGLRDISNLETAPENRQAVETRIARFDEELIRHAILRELNRGGQIYFVHNRINDIHELAAKLQRIVPEASICIGHGQMHEDDLESVMLGFIDKKYDILIATTIIESGLDIPNANTIFIDEADKYGLADLHQLRGRVGRHKHRAYCYLLVDPHKFLSSNSVKRLRAIEEFSSLGAGFAIAMRDLEIRGAGNILGTQQSGHIASVGYELYCELLEAAVRGLQRLPAKEQIQVHLDLPVEAYLPRTYVPDMRLKIDLYRRLSRVTRMDQLADLRAELLDRFGDLPPPVEKMLELGELRILAAQWKIDTIQREDIYAVLCYQERSLIERLAKLSRGKLRIVDHRSAYLPLDAATVASEAILPPLKSLLRLGADAG
ncbi:MAG: transcription-repair coupling factor [Pirellulales bacterium]|nr:transcription-repair coupling factor [Pirellulales bacterium]